MAIFTGDFVFVGSIGRPDLLESAAGSSLFLPSCCSAAYRFIVPSGLL